MISAETQRGEGAAAGGNHQQHPLTFSSDVQSAIDQVLQSTDPLDAPDFNATDYINHLFPTEQSLSSIDDVIGRMESDIGSIDNHIRGVVRGQSTAGQDGRSSLSEAQLVYCGFEFVDLKHFVNICKCEGYWTTLRPDQ